MPGDEKVAKFDKLAPGIFSCVWMLCSVVQVDFNFSPASVTEFRQAIQMCAVILLGGEEVGMRQGAALMVTPLT